MTQIDYPDIHVASPSKRFRLSIVSPDNSDRPRSVEDASISRKIWGGYQSDFTFSLCDQNGTNIWSSDEDIYPHEAWVSDHGWSVVRTHHVFHAGLIVYSPIGERVLDIDLLDEVFDDSDRDRVHDTSAGPFWATASVGYFLCVDSRSLWCIRTWWGRRIVIDLELGKVITTPAVDDHFLKAESHSVMDALTDCLSLWSESSQTEDIRWPGYYGPSFGAAYLAGVLHLDDAIPLLKSLEEISFTGGYRVKRGITAVELPLRQITQLSLRRLGIEPKLKGCYTFYQDRDAIHDPSQSPIELPLVRPDFDKSKISVGMTMLDVLRHIGSPNFIVRETWDFDCVLPIPHSLRIHWTEEDVVESISKVDPPDWIANEKRELWMIH